MATSKMKFVKPPEDPILNVLLYGPPKTGKTIGAASGPPGVLYLNCDLPDATRQAHLRHPDGSLWEPEMPEEGAGGMMPLLAEITHAVQDPSQDIIRTVVVDPIGELHRRLLEDASRRAVRPTLNQFGDVGVHVERFCRMLCRAPVNTVLVAHEWDYEQAGEEGMVAGIWTGTKSGSASLGQKIMGMVNIIGYTGVIEEEGRDPRYVAQVRPGKGRQGGDRFNVLEPIVDVDIAHWVELIKAAETQPEPQPEPEAEKAEPQKATRSRAKTAEEKRAA